MKSILFAAGWEPLIPFLIFFGFLMLSVIQAARKRKQQAEEDWDRPVEIPDGSTDSEGRTIVRRYVRPVQTVPEPGHYPPPHTVVRESRPLSPWEQELERVLRREAPAAPAPTFSPVAPTMPEPPLILSESRPLHRQTTVEELLERDIEGAPMPTSPLASLAKADATYDNASNLADRARQYLQSADSRVAHATPIAPPLRRARSPELTRFLTGLRQPATARQAILAAVILGRPKALEQ